MAITASLVSDFASPFSSPPQKSPLNHLPIEINQLQGAHMVAYGALALTVAAVALARSLLAGLAGLHSSQRLVARATEQILSAPLAALLTLPLRGGAGVAEAVMGRDVDAADWQLPGAAAALFDAGTALGAAVLLVCCFLPAFLVFVSAFLFSARWVIRRHAAAAAALQRLARDSTTAAAAAAAAGTHPLTTDTLSVAQHAADTLRRLPSVRAAHLLSREAAAHAAIAERALRSTLAWEALGRWTAIRLELLGSVALCCAAGVAVLWAEAGAEDLSAAANEGSGAGWLTWLDPGVVGWALYFAFGFTPALVAAAHQAAAAFSFAGAVRCVFHLSAVSLCSEM